MKPQKSCEFKKRSERLLMQCYWSSNLNILYRSKATNVDEDGVVLSSTDSQRGELSGQGLNYRVQKDQVQLGWQTGDETGNLGFKVSGRILFNVTAIRVTQT